MPLYEYECKQCHQRVEKIQSFSAPEITICPNCGGELERVISAPAIQFKGAGWYVNDYAAKKPGSSTASGESKGNAGGTASNDGSSKASDASSSSSDKSSSSSGDGGGSVASSSAPSSAPASSSSGSTSNS